MKLYSRISVSTHCLFKCVRRQWKRLNAKRFLPSISQSSMRNWYFFTQIVPHSTQINTTNCKVEIFHDFAYLFFRFLCFSLQDVSYSISILLCLLKRSRSHILYGFFVPSKDIKKAPVYVVFHGAHFTKSYHLYLLAYTPSTTHYFSIMN